MEYGVALFTHLLKGYPLLPLPLLPDMFMYVYYSCTYIAMRNLIYKLGIVNTCQELIIKKNTCNNAAIELVASLPFGFVAITQ